MLKRRNKKALSEIVATLITILLVIVAMGIVWVVVRDVIQKNSEQISLGKLTLDLQIERVQSNETSTAVKVKRNVGEGNITGIKFIFDDGKNTEIIEREGSLNELQEITYHFTLKNVNGSNLKKVSIAPVFQLESGQEVTGDVKDKLKIT
jgi:flagellin-like protein